VKKPIKATRTRGNRFDKDYTETHPAYGMIAVGRAQSTGHALAGSDFIHHGYMSLRIAPAMLDRGLSSDHWHTSGRRYIEVALSYAQWATLVSAINLGDGVPCTVEWVDDCGVESPEIPGIEHQPSMRRSQLNDEVIETLRDALTKIDAIRAKVPAARQRELDLVKQEIESNLPFVARSFDEHAEETIEKAKIEAEAYLTGALIRAGMSSLGGSPITLESGDDEREARLERIGAVYPDAAAEARRAGKDGET
jgi:hypothetical protein